jgi:hypothetical protein
VEFIPAMYGLNTQHLYISDNPMNVTTPALLRGYMIAAIPRLLSFNGVTISPSERQLAEKSYQPFMNKKTKNVKTFSSISTRTSKQIVQELLNPEPPSKKSSGPTSGAAAQLAFEEFSRQSTASVGFDAFLNAFDVVFKGVLLDTITQLAKDPKDL